MRHATVAQAGLSSDPDDVDGKVVEIGVLG
jgi:hypothetical protein